VINSIRFMFILNHKVDYNLQLLALQVDNNLCFSFDTLLHCCLSLHLKILFDKDIERKTSSNIEEHA
jgi:hypothetical protein